MFSHLIYKAVAYNQTHHRHEDLWDKVYAAQSVDKFCIPGWWMGKRA
jgi:hypothetical protein